MGSVVRDEFKCACCGKNEVKAETVAMFNAARQIAGTPFILNSGWRCKKWNEKVGGKAPSSTTPGSAHLYGLAADIAVRNSQARFSILAGLMRVGFKRIGIYEKFIHADIGGDRFPPEVVWYG